ncbi:hypothetical protein C1924_17050 [Stenotrophomonas sp. ESTM1D_MKCIP4_1]|uniref:hypothetical protein n=1 Tax=Stenotrophomonas sp. ESTM1D_MKCIP4_1 TaxID=2072414 RepID=UPI000D53DBC1|nr:hypothetical protein [Stenotrophomonas sp. ESTM1D_MKCIP4_1]AWH54765.1 hypothetical protein C1924_17050 [Stenotrophomonas sp. ESTM1D_MKCIP4_1]
MTASRYPHLFATLGEAANELPDDIAQALETTLTATQDTPSPGAITLLGCLQRIRQGDAADGQPWPRKGHTPGQCLALARANRANVGLTFLLELLHAAERARVEGDESQHIGNGARDELLLACRGLSEYVDLQLHAA